MIDIKEYGIKVCELLMIKKPEIKLMSSSDLIDISNYEDTSACYDRSTNTVYIIKRDKYELIDFYSLSHELRHVWQNKTDPELFFGDYNEESVESQYHRLLAEVDANAFACIAIAMFFGKVTRRTYKNDPEAQKIYEDRLKALKREYEIDF